MKVCCFGAGYVGGPTMAVLASKTPKNNYYVFDINAEIIKKWNDLQPPIYEIGLLELLQVSSF